MGRTKLGPKRTKIWRWTPREPYGKYKIKTFSRTKNNSNLKKRTSNKNNNHQKKNKIY